MPVKLLSTVEQVVQQIHNKSKLVDRVRGLQLTQPRRVDCCIGVVNKLDRRRRRRVYPESRVWGKVSDGSTVILQVPEFSYKTVYTG